MNPFDTIVRVLRLPETILAYDAEDGLVAELTEDGLNELRFRQPQLLVESRLSSETFEVRVRTTGPVYLAKDTSPATVDGILLKQGDLVLVAEQPDLKKNAIYRVYNADNRAAHTPNTWWVLAGEQPQGTIYVLEGKQYGGSFWTLTAGCPVRVASKMPPTA